MKSSYLVWGLAAAVAYMAYKGRLPFGGAIGPQTPTKSSAQGASPVASQGGPSFNFQKTTDDITSMFGDATKLFGGSSAQTNPQTM